jgi:hypothetical protein
MSFTTSLLHFASSDTVVIPKDVTPEKVNASEPISRWQQVASRRRSELVESDPRQGNGYHAVSKPIETNLVNAFINRLHEATVMDEHAAVDEVFNFLDDLLLAGKFEVCDRALAWTDPSSLHPSSVVAFLMVTLRAKGRLPARADFLTRGISAISRKEGRKEAEALLGNYR